MATDEPPPGDTVVPELFQEFAELEPSSLRLVLPLEPLRAELPDELPDEVAAVPCVAWWLPTPTAMATTPATPASASEPVIV